jgi:membrane protease YdiL (CAAX protease family)
MTETHGASRTVLMTALALAYGAVSQRALGPRTTVPVNIAAGAGAVLLARHWGATWTDLGLEPGRLAGGLRAGLAIVPPIAAAVSSGAAHPRTRPLFADERVLRSSSGDAAYQVLVRIPVGTAATEELLFRSALLAVASSWLGPRRAVACSSLAFGLWHVLPALDAHGSNLAGAATVERVGGRSAAVAGTVAVTTAAGIALCALRLRARSVAASIIAHAVLNGAGFVAARGVGRSRAAPVAR